MLEYLYLYKYISYSSKSSRGGGGADVLNMIHGLKHIKCPSRARRSSRARFGGSPLSVDVNAAMQKLWRNTTTGDHMYIYLFIYFKNK